MIKIIEEGQRNFIAKCPNCGCKFSYQLRDIGLGCVNCPCCGYYVAHKLDEYTSRTTETENTTVDAFDSLQTISDLCVDYDGFNTVEGLKSLVDDIRGITEENLAGKGQG